MHNKEKLPNCLLISSLPGQTRNSIGMMRISEARQPQRQEFPLKVDLISEGLSHPGKNKLS